MLALTRSIGQRVRIGADRIDVRDLRKPTVTLEVLPRRWTLVLREGESAMIRPGIKVAVAWIDGANRVRLGIEAPRSVIILREEIAREYDRARAELDREEREGGSWR